MKPTCSHCGGSGTEPEPATVENRQLAAALTQLGWHWETDGAPGEPGWYEDNKTGAVRVFRRWPGTSRDDGQWTYFHDQGVRFDTAEECVLWVANGYAKPAPEPARPPAVTREEFDKLAKEHQKLWTLVRNMRLDEDEARRDADRRGRE